jgi:Zn-dependent protease with chaperone function
MTYLSPNTINTSKGFGELLTYVNYATNNWISNMLLIAIYVIVLMGFYKAKDDFKGALAVAGYGTFVVSLLFWIGGFVSGWALGIAIAMAILGTIVLLLDNPN